MGQAENVDVDHSRVVGIGGQTSQAVPGSYAFLP